MLSRLLSHPICFIIFLQKLFWQATATAAAASQIEWRLCWLSLYFSFPFCFSCPFKATHRSAELFCVFCFHLFHVSILAAVEIDLNISLSTYFPIILHQQQFARPPVRQSVYFFSICQSKHCCCTFPFSWSSLSYVWVQHQSGRSSVSEKIYIWQPWTLNFCCCSQTIDSKLRQQFPNFFEIHLFSKSYNDASQGL